MALQYPNYLLIYSFKIFFIENLLCARNDIAEDVTESKTRKKFWTSSRREIVNKISNYQVC